MTPLVYLCGGITGYGFDKATSWRLEVMKELAKVGIKGLNPMRGKEYLVDEVSIADHYDEKIMSTEAAIMQRDRWDVQRSNALFACFLGAARVSIGSVMEIAWADACRIPIIIVMEENNIHQHAMVRRAAGYIMPTLEEGINVTKYLFS